MLRIDAQVLRRIVFLLFVSRVFSQHVIDTALLPVRVLSVGCVFVPLHWLCLCQCWKYTDLFEYILRGQAHCTSAFMSKTFAVR